MVEILVQHGADIFAQDRNGKTGSLTLYARRGVCGVRLSLWMWEW